MLGIRRPAMSRNAACIAICDRRQLVQPLFPLSRLCILTPTHSKPLCTTRRPYQKRGWTWRVAHGYVLVLEYRVLRYLSTLSECWLRIPYGSRREARQFTLSPPLGPQSEATDGLFKPQKEGNSASSPVVFGCLVLSHSLAHRSAAGLKAKTCPQLLMTATGTDVIFARGGNRLP